MMKSQKKWLYAKWLEEHRQAEEQKNISNKIGVEKDRIVVRKVSFWAKLAEILTDLFFKALSLLVFVVLILLLSLAATVLINPGLRDYVFKTLGSMF